MPTRFEYAQRIQMLAALQALSEPKAEDWVKTLEIDASMSKIPSNVSSVVGPDSPSEVDGARESAQDTESQTGTRSSRPLHDGDDHAN